MPVPDVLQRWVRTRWHAVPILLAAWLSGCSSVAYYGQLASGQLQLLRARESVGDIIADPARDPALRKRLALSQDARRFATDHLHLPDNQSYRVYADIGRPFVVWNVFATDEFSLEPITHCFPIAGCVAYRGYYRLGAARGEAALQRQAGKDVFVAGIEAYSTLGWFNDPILNTMLGWGDERLATLIFHELAHQRFYVKDDTAFNESYASFVEQQGTRQWRAARGLPALADPRAAQRDALTRLVLDTRQRLRALYAQPLAAPVMRQRKAAEFERLRQDYRSLWAQKWPGDKRFDAWINAPMNNARLLPFGLYDQWVPAFAALFAQVNGDWPAFYTRVEQLGNLAPVERTAALQALMP